MKRQRQASRRDNLAGWLVLILVAVLGWLAILLAGPARADVVDRYIVTFGEAVCSTLDKFPSADGVLGIVRAIHQDGLTWEQAGTVMVQSVITYCPDHVPLIERTVRQVRPDGVAIA